MLCVLKMMMIICLVLLLLVMNINSVQSKVTPFYPVGSVVRDLDAKTVDEILMSEGDEKYLIVYYAPWCGKFLINSSFM